MSNLLQNGDFTADWGEQSSHRAWVCRPGETPQIAQIGNIFSPPGFDTWFRHEPDLWDQPEVRDARSDDRLYDGHKAMLLFTFYRKHWGGFLQVVPTVPGKRYRLTAWAHAWSNSQNGPHVDDPRWSEGPGYGAGYISPPLAQGAAPPAGSPGSTDDWRNFAFNVGLDPTGGVDPFGAGLVWGAGASIYNVYAQVPAIEVTATGERMTAFLRSRTLWPFKHNDAYWGAALLEDVTPEKPRGYPRVQYARTYNVIPADASEEQAVAVFLDGWRRSKETAGGSYDDAGVGCLDVRKARLYGIPSERRAEFVAWYAEHYPGVEVEFAWFPGETEPNPSQPPDQGGQTEPWSVDIVDLLAHNTGPYTDATLTAQGGWWQRTPGQITGLTVHHTLSNDPYATANAYIQKEGGRPSIPYHIWIGKDGAVTLTNRLTEGLWHDHTGNRNTNISVGLAGDGRVAALPEPQMASLVNVAAWAVRNPDMSVAYTKIKGHQDYISTACPGWQYGWKEAFYSRLRAALGIVTPTPDPQPQPTPTPVAKGTSPIGYHAQVWAPWMHTMNTELKMRLVKSVDGLENIYSVLPANPDCTFVYRQFAEQHTPMQGTPAQGAAIWISKWIDSVRNVCNELEKRGIAPSGRPYFLVESLNETYACFDPRNAWMVEFDREFIRQLRQAEPRVGAAVFCAPVGNPHESEFDMLTPLAVDVSKAGPWAVLSYHAYWWGNRVDGSGMTREHWPYLQGRWAEMDKVFRKAGAYPRWYFGESGVVGGRPTEGGGYYLNAGSGWLDAADCYGGDWPRYEQDWQTFLTWCDETPAGRDGLILGANPFTTGAPYTGWQWFQFQEAQYRALAAWLKARYL